MICIKTACNILREMRFKNYVHFACNNRFSFDAKFRFVTQAYTESVPQDLPVGREVMRVSATDIDDGNNSVVRYSLAAKKTDDAAYFRIDSESGIIFLNKAIDVSNMREEEMLIRR